MELRYGRLIAYDIADDKKRQRVARYLETLGLRIQKSVFVVNLRPEKLKTVANRLDTMRDSNDIIDLIPVCGNCRKLSIRLGPEVEPAKVVTGADETEYET